METEQPAIKWLLTNPFSFMASFIHPAHAKGLRSPNLSGGSNKPLTDRRIKAYILAGRYGEEMRQNELAKQKPKSKDKPIFSLKEFKHLLR